MPVLAFTAGKQRARPLAIVAAVGRNGAIGQAKRLPWTMPTDLVRFRHLTMGKPMIMGRRTFDSIGRVLPGRESIVVSSFDLELPRGAVRAVDPRHALEIAMERAAAMNAEEIPVIGGALLFDEMISLATRLHMTFVDLAPHADAFFPTIVADDWREVSRVVPPRDPKDDASCVFVEYVRK